MSAMSLDEAVGARLARWRSRFDVIENRGEAKLRRHDFLEDFSADPSIICRMPSVIGGVTVTMTRNADRHAIIATIVPG